MLLLVSGSGHLQIGYIYIVNSIIGMMNAFQGPASAVAVGKLVPQDKLANVSGMQSFSSNLTSVLAPVIAASLYGFSGLNLILLFDLASFVLAFLVLLLLIQIPEEKIINKDRKSPFSGCGEGFTFLLHNKGILTIVVTMALLNFFSRLTYENILSPMILSRSGGDSLALGTVNALMGIGGSGMAVMFLCTGLLGCLFSVISYRMKEIQKLK